jgi:hypothetical protein
VVLALLLCICACVGLWRRRQRQLAKERDVAAAVKPHHTPNPAFIGGAGADAGAGAHAGADAGADLETNVATISKDSPYLVPMAVTNASVTEASTEYAEASGRRPATRRAAAAAAVGVGKGDAGDRSAARHVVDSADGGSGKPPVGPDDRYGHGNGDGDSCGGIPEYVDFGAERYEQMEAPPSGAAHPVYCTPIEQPAKPRLDPAGYVYDGDVSGAPGVGEPTYSVPADEAVAPVNTYADLTAYC